MAWPARSARLANGGVERTGPGTQGAGTSRGRAESAAGRVSSSPNPASLVRSCCVCAPQPHAAAAHTCRVNSLIWHIRFRDFGLRFTCDLTSKFIAKCRADSPPAFRRPPCSRAHARTSDHPTRRRRGFIITCCRRDSRRPPTKTCGRRGQSRPKASGGAET